MTDDAAQGRLEASDADRRAYTRRREALHRAVAELDRELDALREVPGPDPERFGAAIRALLTTLHQHREEAEAPDGLLGRIVEAAPWFAPRVEQLKSEHDEQLRVANGLLERARGRADVAPLIGEAQELSTRLSEHRHRGTTLLMDAYMLDIPEAD